MCGCKIFFQAEDGIRDVERSRGLGDVYKRQILRNCNFSDTFIQQANDLQIMEAISECYDEYKLLEF